MDSGDALRRLCVRSVGDHSVVALPEEQRVEAWLRHGETADGTWTGGTIWKSSQALSRYLVALPPEVWRGAAVLELGCGCALSGLTAAALGAHSVLLTDMVLHAAEQNRDASFPEAADRQRVQLAPLRWGDDVDLAAIQRCPTANAFDLVLCSDLLYHKPAYKPLAKTLRALCGPRTVVLLCTPNGRNPDEDHFFQETRRLGFNCCFTVWDWSLLPHYAKHYGSDLPVMAKWMVSDELLDPSLAEIGFSALGFARGDRSKANAGEVHLSFMMVGDGQ